jgi:putative DNA primase/helicase
MTEITKELELASHKDGNGAHEAAAPQPTSEPKYKPDDDEIALALAHDWKGKVAFFHSEWKVYEGGYWVGRDGSEVRRFIRKYLRDWRSRGVTVSQNRIKSLASMLEDDLFISDRVIMERARERAQYVNLRNGMFNLSTMEFEPHHRADLFFTNQLDFDYDPDADCPTFRRYLNTSLVYPDSTKTDHTLKTLLLQALGYSMTARTDLKASFWLVGAKDSGKSTFVALLKSLMGSLYGTIDLTQLGTNRFLLAGIVGKRVVAFTEASGSSLLPDALYKALTGGSDEIYADVKNREPITFRPEAKIWWAMNEKPRMADRSGATTRRIIIIPFNRTIPEHERIHNLEQLLIKERPGIFNEMVSHYARLVSAGGQFEYCEQSERQRQEYILENDTEATYIQDRALVHESYKVQGSTLYADYQRWCEVNGFKAKSANQVASEWRRLGFTLTKSNGLSVWQGLKLRE